MEYLGSLVISYIKCNIAAVVDSDIFQITIINGNERLLSDASSLAPKNVLVALEKENTCMQ